MTREAGKAGYLSVYYTPSEMARWGAYAAAENLPTSSAVKRLAELGLEYLKVRARPIVPANQDLSPKLESALHHLEVLIHLSAESLAVVRSRVPSTPGMLNSIKNDAQAIEKASLTDARSAPKGSR